MFSWTDEDGNEWETHEYAGDSIRADNLESFPPEDEPTPCDYGDHDWTEVFDGDCSFCRQCGAYDC